MDTNNDITKMMKLRSLQCVSEIMYNHVQSVTEFHIFLMSCYPISDKIIYDIYLACTLAIWLPIIIFQFDGALVILIHNIFMDILPLFFQEAPGPDHLGHGIMH